MRIEIKPGAPAGEIAAPPSKSCAHRMLICAALAAWGTEENAAPESGPEMTPGAGRYRSEKTSVITGIGGGEDVSEDILATADCIRALGIGCRISGGEARITGRRAGIPWKKPEITGGEPEAAGKRPGSGDGLPVFLCRESGSTLRFFIPIAMALAGGGVFTGSERLMQRGIEVYEELFAPCVRPGGAAEGNLADRVPDQALKAERSAAYERAEEAIPPAPQVRITRESGRIIVEGRLMPGEMTVRGDVSSQFISGLLYALPMLEGDSILHVTRPIESRLYIDITIDVMRSFGVIVEEPVFGTFNIRGRQHYEPGDKTVEGDWSNAAFLYAMKFLHEEDAEWSAAAAGRDRALRSGDEEDCDAGAVPGTLQICGLNPDSLQGDKICLEHFRKLDSIARVSSVPKEDEQRYVTAENSGMEWSDACRRGLIGECCDMDPIDLTNCPDLGPVLFVYAAARGGGRFTGVRRLRIKESDRIACMQEELTKFGIKTRSGEDELVVYPGEMQAPAEVLNGHNDHRIVMALAVLCTLTGGEIDDAQAVGKSWPDFWRVMTKLGIRTREVPPVAG